MKQPKASLWLVHVIKYLSTVNVLEDISSYCLLLQLGSDAAAKNFISFYYYELGQINFLLRPFSDHNFLPCGQLRPGQMSHGCRGLQELSPLSLFIKEGKLVVKWKQEWRRLLFSILETIANS